MRKILASLTLLALILPAGARAQDSAARIIRDQWGIAHIYAPNERLLLMANGYAQAQDRLAQMEILRHVGQGRLAELVGPSGLELDLVTRRELYTEEERVAALQALPPQWRQAFAAYTRGVNRWIDEVRADPTKLPVEYPALVEVPEPWKETDSIAIAQFLLDVFGRGGGGDEVGNAKLLAKLTETLGAANAPDALTDLVWVQRDATYTTIKAEDAAAWPTPAAERPHDLGTLPDAQKEAIAAAMAAQPVDDTDATLADAARAAGVPWQLGSNAQLIDERFSASGKPLLFGGPQMGYFAPMVPYEVGLHGGGFDVVGMGVAGTPGVIIGRTAHQSWTVTSGSSDQVDFVVEKLTDPTHYEVDGQIHEMDCRTEVHLVRPGPADLAGDRDPSDGSPKPDVLRQEVCRTIHGPVIYRTPDGRYAIASHRSYRGDEVRSGTLWLQVGTTQSREEFQDLFETFRFEFNFHYVNDSGELMYMHTGAQPVRDERLDPRLPRPGWDSSFDWKNTLTGRQLPHVVDPASGYIVNWNNNPAKGWPSGDIREQWGDVHRAELMEAALKPVLDRGNVTMEDMRAVNEYASTHEPFAGDFYPLFHGAAVSGGHEDAMSAFEAWKASGYDWADRDGDGDHDYDAFRLYELWREKMQSLVFDDEIDGHVRRIVWDPPASDDPHAADHGNTGNKHTILAHIATGQTAHSWCDDVATASTETCAELSRTALESSLAQWRTETPFPMRQIRFVPLGAGQAYKIPMVNRPSFQHFYDWGLPEGPERSRNVLPPGTSGHMTTIDFLNKQARDNGFPSPLALPPHLSDQLQMYVGFEDKPLLFAEVTILGHKRSDVLLYE